VCSRWCNSNSAGDECSDFSRIFQHLRKSSLPENTSLQLISEFGSRTMFRNSVANFFAAIRENFPTAGIVNNEPIRECIAKENTITTNEVTATSVVFSHNTTQLPVSATAYLTLEDMGNDIAYETIDVVSRRYRRNFLILPT
jgi:hypothetical protein